MQSIAARNTFTSVLAKHGVVNKGYKDCTNAIYIGLFGESAEKVRENKNLPINSNIRENMSILELSAVSFAETLAAESIEENRMYGNQECAITANRAARGVSNTINNFKNNKI